MKTIVVLLILQMLISAITLCIIFSKKTYINKKEINARELTHLYLYELPNCIIEEGEITDLNYLKNLYL